MIDAAPPWTEARYRRIAALLAPYVKIEET